MARPTIHGGNGSLCQRPSSVSADGSSTPRTATLPTDETVRGGGLREICGEDEQGFGGMHSPRPFVVVATLVSSLLIGLSLATAAAADDAPPTAPTGEAKPSTTVTKGVDERGSPASLESRSSAPTTTAKGKPTAASPGRSAAGTKKSSARRKGEGLTADRVDANPTPVAAPLPAPVVETRAIRVRQPDGETVIARFYGSDDEKSSLLLPDGQIAFTNGLVDADEPFRPATFDAMREELTGSGEFAHFKVRQSAHYLVLYQSSDTFAEASGKLLEDLYKNLSEALRKRDFPVHEPEFPLVAVIFRTEEEFRRRKQVDAEVQAYYEILSNRIYFYQKSNRDDRDPEVAALRRPQTVAHEGTHQILQNIGIQPRLSDWPLWLVEGLAEYCSPPTMSRKGAAWGGIGQVNAIHMATISDLEDPASLQAGGANGPRVVRDPRTPLVEYLVTRKELTATDYALSWAMTHYLAKELAPKFLAFLRTMSQLEPMKTQTPEDQLTAFRAAFGNDLMKMDKAVAIHLRSLKYTPLPFYAVMFQQPIGRGQIRRAVYVSQSPTMIHQWIQEISAPDGGPTNWEVHPFPNRSRALQLAENWLRNP